MRRVIINADDFGLSPGVNRGIVSAFHDGVLSSTTMLVNLSHFDDAVALAAANPKLPVGIHLSLLWGSPLSDPKQVPTLVDRQGRFPRSLLVLARRYFAGSLRLDDVAREFRAQIGRFRAAGLRPTHVDTHKHVHCLPGVLQTLVDVLIETGIGRLRFPYERDITSRGGLQSSPLPSVKSRLKRDVVRILCRSGRSTIERRGLRTTDHFAGIAHMESLNASTLRYLLANVGEGSTELMCHPGYDDGRRIEYSSTPPHRRETELTALKDPDVRAALDAHDIRLISYDDI